MTQIASLKERGLTGVHLLAVFLKNRAQPLQARAEPMWSYRGVEDINRLRKEELSSNELDTFLSNIIKSSCIELTPLILPFLATNPPVPVSFCLLRAHTVLWFSF